jgi:hypothetical protein
MWHACEVCCIVGSYAPTYLAMVMNTSSKLSLRLLCTMNVNIMKLPKTDKSDYNKDQ